MTLEEPRDYGAARDLAERVAALVDKPLADSSSGATVVREPDSLDLSLREPGGSSGQRIEVPDPRPQMHSQVSIDGSRVSIEIPATGIRAGHKLVMGVLFAFLVFDALFLMPVSRLGDSSGGADLPLFFAFAGMMFVVPLIAVGRLVLASAHKRVSIRASCGGLRADR